MTRTKALLKLPLLSACFFRLALSFERRTKRLLHRGLKEVFPCREPLPM